MWPSRKWWAARVTALTTLAITWATSGSWDLEETLFAIGIVSAGFLSWLLPNHEDAPQPAVLEARERRR